MLMVASSIVNATTSSWIVAPSHSIVVPLMFQAAIKDSHYFVEAIDCIKL